MNTIAPKLEYTELTDPNSSSQISADDVQQEQAFDMSIIWGEVWWSNILIF